MRNAIFQFVKEETGQWKIDQKGAAVTWISFYFPDRRALPLKKKKD